MTNKERVLAAIHFRDPEYTPHFVDFTTQMYEKMVAYTGDPNYIKTVNNHVTMTILNAPQVEIRPGFFRDEFGVIWNKTGADKDIGVIDNILLQEPEDLETFQFPSVDEPRIRAQLQELQDSDPNNFRIAAIGFTIFERAWTLRGMEDLLCDMILNPEFVNALLDKITENLMQILDIALEYDFDCFHFGDDWGQQRGLIMGPQAWRTYIKPRMAKLYAKVHEAGKYVSQHSCGDLRDVMEDLHEIGLNIYQTFQPEIYGYDYAQKLYGKITVWGGLSTQQALPCKTPAQIKEILADMMAHFPHGGLIAAPTHSVPGDVPPENILAMMEVFQNQ